MADRTVSVTISARDNFSSVINKYQQAMGQAGQATTRLNQQSGGLKGGIDQLNSSFNVLFGAGIMGVGLAKVAQLGSEMQQLGAKVNSARSVFDTLTGGVGEAAVTLQMLRESTHGTVADLDLMQSANALLLQGLAQTNEQAADLTGIAVTLGRAMGEDAHGAVEKFSQLLRNQSIRLLDNFGLSSARVKDRMAALQSQFAGMSREQAFVQATIEESRLAIDRLGDSTVVVGSSTERLATMVSNAWEQASSNVAAGIEGIAYAITTLIDAQEEAVRRGQELERSTTLQDKRRSERGGGALRGVEGRLTNAAQSVAESLGLSPEAAQQTVSLYMEAIRQAFEGGAEIGQITDILRQQYGDTDPIINALIASLEGVPDVLQDLGKASYAAFGEMHKHISTVDRDTNNLIDSYREMYNESRRVQAAEESRARIINSLAGVQSNGLAGLISMRREAGSVAAHPGATYNTRAESDAINAMLAEAEQRLKEMEDSDIVSQSDLEHARTLVDSMREMADQAERGADAMDRLSTAFGQTGGGLQGEVNQAVLDQMRAGGATEEQIAAFQRTGALATGQETRGSLAFQEQIAPMIAQATQQLGPEVGAALTAAVAEYIQSQGGNATGEGMLGAMTNAGLLLGAGGGPQITVRPGDTVSGLAAQYGMTQEQIMQATGTTNPRLLQPGTYGGGYGGLGFDFQGGSTGATGGYADYSQMATSTGEISDDYSQIATDASATADYVQSAMSYAEQWRDAQAIVSGDIAQARSDLEALTGDVQQVTVAIEFTGDLETLKALMNGDLEVNASVNVDDGGGGSSGTRKSMERATRDNYGTPPGVDRRVVGPRGL